MIHRDLRSADAIAAATNSGARPQDYRSPDAVDAAAARGGYRLAAGRPSGHRAVGEHLARCRHGGGRLATCGLLLLGLIATFIVRRRHTGHGHVNA